MEHLLFVLERVEVEAAHAATRLRHEADAHAVAADVERVGDRTHEPDDVTRGGGRQREDDVGWGALTARRHRFEGCSCCSCCCCCGGRGWISHYNIDSVQDLK